MSAAETPSVQVYGAGRVGLAVARLAARRGVRVVGLWNPRDLRPDRAELAAGLPVEVAPGPPPRAADLWLLAVPDDAVTEVAEALARALDEDPDAPHPAAAAHCAGAHPAALLAALSERGVPVASWHPAMTFRGATDDSDALAGARIGVEGDPAACDVVAGLSAALGLAVVPLATASKPWYHAALVFAANGRVALDAVATRLLAEAGIDGEEAREILAPLVARTDANLADATAAEALTGPVARGDARTVRAQVEALADRPEALDLYRALGAVALGLVPEVHRGAGHREVARLLGAEEPTLGRTPC